MVTKAGLSARMCLLKQEISGWAGLCRAYPAIPAAAPWPHDADPKHTFGRELRAAGVPLETRKVLLGHRNGDITSHYSAPEIEELLEAANRVCRKSPALTLLKRKTA